MTVTGETTPMSSEALRANQELDQRFCDAMSKMDIEQVMTCFWDSPDFIFVGTDGTVVLGADGLRKSVEDWFAQCESLRLVIDEVRHVPVADSVFAVGTATYTIGGKDASVQTLTERWTDVRRQIDGRWIYVLDHAHAL